MRARAGAAAAAAFFFCSCLPGVVFLPLDEARDQILPVDNLTAEPALSGRGVTLRWENPETNFSAIRLFRVRRTEPAVEIELGDLGPTAPDLFTDAIEPQVPYRYTVVVEYNGNQRADAFVDVLTEDHALDPPTVVVTNVGAGQHLLIFVNEAATAHIERFAGVVEDVPARGSGATVGGDTCTLPCDVIDPAVPLPQTFFVWATDSFGNEATASGAAVAPLPVTADEEPTHLGVRVTASVQVSFAAGGGTQHLHAESVAGPVEGAPAPGAGDVAADVDCAPGTCLLDLPVVARPGSYLFWVVDAAGNASPPASLAAPPPFPAQEDSFSVSFDGVRASLLLRHVHPLAQQIERVAGDVAALPAGGTTVVGDAPCSADFNGDNPLHCRANDDAVAPPVTYFARARDAAGNLSSPVRVFLPAPDPPIAPVTLIATRTALRTTLTVTHVDNPLRTRLAVARVTSTPAGIDDLTGPFLVDCTTSCPPTQDLVIDNPGPAPATFAACVTYANGLEACAEAATGDFSVSVVDAMVLSGGSSETLKAVGGRFADGRPRFVRMFSDFSSSASFFATPDATPRSIDTSDPTVIDLADFSSFPEGPLDESTAPLVRTAADGAYAVARPASVDFFVDDVLSWSRATTGKAVDLLADERGVCVALDDSGGSAEGFTTLDNGPYDGMVACWDADGAPVVQAATSDLAGALLARSPAGFALRFSSGFIRRHHVDGTFAGGSEIVDVAEDDATPLATLATSVSDLIVAFGRGPTGGVELVTFKDNGNDNLTRVFWQPLPGTQKATLARCRNSNFSSINAAVSDAGVLLVVNNFDVVTAPQLGVDDVTRVRTGSTLLNMAVLYDANLQPRKSIERASQTLGLTLEMADNGDIWLPVLASNDATVPELAGTPALNNDGVLLRLR